MVVVIALLFLLVAGFVIYIYAAGPTLSPETNAIIDGVLTNELPEIVVGQTGFAPSNGLQIWYESIAPTDSPKGTVLLLIGMAGDALNWPPSFVRAFVGAGYQVVRYDQRGTGMSDWVKNWDRKQPYSLADMAQDAVAVLDALEVRTAHLVGLSMGGMIAQEIALHRPDRVASLTLLMTSGHIGDPDLPGLSSRYFVSSFLKGIPLLKYRLMGGEKNLIKERIAKTISVVGYDGLDIKETAELVLYDLRKRRGLNLKAILQHQTAITLAGSRYDRLRTLDVPTLIIHGTADQFIPVEHGLKLVEIIPHAQGLWLDGVGHIFPMPDMETLLKNIFAHLKTSEVSTDHQPRPANRSDRLTGEDSQSIKTSEVSTTKSTSDD
jgi:pimeloyl-ACP methyl ester carboxylesterase